MFYFCLMRKKTIVAAGGIVENENREILLIFRRKVWDLPKGKIDKGETIEQCAVREVEEETGLRNVELKAFVHTTYHDYFDKWLMKDVTKETHWYAMQVNGPQQLVPQADEDIEDILWVAATDIVRYKNNMHKNIIEVIDIYLAAHIS